MELLFLAHSASLRVKKTQVMLVFCSENRVIIMDFTELLVILQQHWGIFASYLTSFIG